jgi:hypothetical protein
MDQIVGKFSNAQLESIQLFAGNLNANDLGRIIMIFVDSFYHCN